MTATPDDVNDDTLAHARDVLVQLRGVVELRLPDELKRWLHHQAIDNRRALNSEILVRLEESRKRQEATDAKT